MEKTKTEGLALIMRKRIKTYYLKYKGKKHPFFKSKNKGMKIGKRYLKFKKVI